MSETKFVVGQRVWLFNINARGRGPEEVAVTKVGRKLVTVGDDWSAKQFRIEDGSSNDRNYGHHTWIRTDEEVAEQDRRNAAVAALTKARLRLDYGCQLTTDDLVAVVDLLAARLGVLDKPQPEDQ